jgi:ankyrin repeat protein
LHLAAARGHLKVIEYFVNKGANVNAADDNRLTPLGSALARYQAEAAALLRRNGARQ